jgi:hypothetical protein
MGVFYEKFFFVDFHLYFTQAAFVAHPAFGAAFVEATA